MAGNTGEVHRPTMEELADYVERQFQRRTDVRNTFQEPEMGEVYLFVKFNDGRCLRVIVECPE